MQEFKEICFNARGLELNGVVVIVYPYDNYTILQPVDYNDEDNVMDGVLLKNFSWKELRRAYNTLEEIIAEQKRG